jgi:hypothetical protein
MRRRRTTATPEVSDSEWVLHAVIACGCKACTESPTYRARDARRAGSGTRAACQHCSLFCSRDHTYPSTITQEQAATSTSNERGHRALLSVPRDAASEHGAGVQESGDVVLCGHGKWG